MPLADTMNTTRVTLQSALDDLISPRSSSKSQLKALQNIEKSLGQALLITTNDLEAKFCFTTLQYTFECNVPAHLVAWIIKSTARLEAAIHKGAADASNGQSSDTQELVSQLILSLSLMQGIALNHESSKIYLGRRPTLETLLDLLLTSRHLSNQQDASEAKNKSTPSCPHLSSIVIDTLLCILVDSSAALRVFESVSGVQAVVKILKRAGTPREVRMKCLEFLYFYLLDETPASSPERAYVADLISPQPSPPPTAPVTPIRTHKPYLSGGPKFPSSRYGSSTYAFSLSTGSTAALSVSSLSTTSSRSTSSSSTKSFSSTTSNASSSTPASSLSASPIKDSNEPLPALDASPVKRAATPGHQKHRMPPVTPSTTSSFSSAARFPHLKSTLMLKKDVDFTPESPRKPSALRLSPRPTHEKSLSMSSPSTISRTSSLAHSRSQSQASILEGLVNDATSSPREAGTLQKLYTQRHQDGEKRKTTEEKKELLGTLLGNVDALVEGVRKAGIWGLPE